jgi:hypothetical protein
MANDMAISFQDVRGAAGNRPRSTMNIAASRTIPGSIAKTSSRDLRDRCLTRQLAGAIA